jgi:hypothetical protein
MLPTLATYTDGMLEADIEQDEMLLEVRCKLQNSVAHISQEVLMESYSAIVLYSRNWRKDAVKLCISNK